MNRKLLWKYVITGIMSVCLMVALTACSASEESEAGGQIASNQMEEPVTRESVDSKEEVQQVEAEVENTEETIGENVEDIEQEMVETVVLEESQAEMVDFETWAKQEGNDQVCLVVWNEELGIQEIVPTFQETEEIYNVQKGDKFAIPYRESIIYIGIDDESQMWSNTEYLELSFQSEKATQITIIFENESGEDENKNYFFK